jgi:hypothetical protein
MTYGDMCYIWASLALCSLLWRSVVCKLYFIGWIQLLLYISTPPHPSFLSVTRILVRTAAVGELSDWLDPAAFLHFKPCAPKLPL